MYSNCSTEEAVRRQRQLAQCLLELMKTETYRRITIGSICSRAGVSRKSFYRYFSDKDGCLNALVDQVVMEAVAFCLPSLRSRQEIHSVFERFFSYWQQRADLVDALCRNEMSECLVRRTMRYLTEEEPGIQRRLDMDDESILFIVTGAMHLMLSRHLTGYRKTPGQMADILDRLMK